MKNISRAKIIVGVAVLLTLALAAGGWFYTSAWAQGPWQGGVAHDNQAVLDVLKSTQNELLQQRQAGKSWLDIATAKGVSQDALVGALMQEVNEHHAWMGQQVPQFNGTQMTEWMRAQFAKDLSVSAFGTMTDRHVFGGGGMMGNFNGTSGNMPFGMMRGWGMMGNWNTDGNNNWNAMPHGWMMGNWNNNNGNGTFGGMHGGMMRGWNTAPNPTPAPAQ